MLFLNRIATLRRSKVDLGVNSAKDGLNGIWYWYTRRRGTATTHERSKMIK
jgi:hypothetical protein